MSENKTKETPFYVFDNVHDWINEVNLGNGLADLLCHYAKVPKSAKNHPTGRVSKPETFVRYANRHLENKISIEEIRELLKYHHPDYKCSR